MSIPFLSSVDFAGNEIRSVDLENLSSAPSSPAKGRIYFNTTGNFGYVWNGSAWRPLDPAALTDGSIHISALETNPLARANHTGTQAAATISDLATVVKAYRLDEFAVPTANVSMGSHKLTNLTDPSSAQDAATMNYVDNSVQSAAAGIDSKPSVRAIATSNVTISNPATAAFDGTTLSVGNRILLVGQTTASQNGVYVFNGSSVAMTRAADADQTGEITPGATWFVEEGVSYGGTTWRCNNTGTVTLGSTAITIVQFLAAAMYAAGNGLTLSGTTFSAQLNGSTLTNGGSGLAVNPTVIPSKCSGTIIGDSSTTVFVIEHDLGTRNIIVAVQDTTTNKGVWVDWDTTSANHVRFTFATAPAGGQNYSVLVVG